MTQEKRLYEEPFLMWKVLPNSLNKVSESMEEEYSNSDNDSDYTPSLASIDEEDNFRYWEYDDENIDVYDEIDNVDTLESPLNDEDGDDNSIDERLWGSEVLKQEWIQRYERFNQEHVSTFGCSIDTEADPFVYACLHQSKKKIQEAKWKQALSFILIAIALYLQIYWISQSESAVFDDVVHIDNNLTLCFQSTERTAKFQHSNDIDHYNLLVQEAEMKCDSAMHTESIFQQIYAKAAKGDIECRKGQYQKAAQQYQAAMESFEKATSNKSMYKFNLTNTEKILAFKAQRAQWFSYFFNKNYEQLAAYCSEYLSQSNPINELFEDAKIWIHVLGELSKDKEYFDDAVLEVILNFRESTSLVLRPDS